MDLGDYNPGQWEWKPPTTTTTETTFIETSPIQEPLSGDFKVRNEYMAQSNSSYPSQLPDRLFSQRDICKKLSQYFFLHFPIGIGSYDQHAKYQDVFP